MDCCRNNSRNECYSPWIPRIVKSIVCYFLSNLPGLFLFFNDYKWGDVKYFVVHLFSYSSKIFLHLFPILVLYFSLHTMEKFFLFLQSIFQKKNRKIHRLQSLSFSVVSFLVANVAVRDFQFSFWRLSNFYFKRV